MWHLAPFDFSELETIRSDDCSIPCKSEAMARKAYNDAMGADVAEEWFGIRPSKVSTSPR